MPNWICDLGNVAWGSFTFAVGLVVFILTVAISLGLVVLMGYLLRIGWNAA